MSRNKENVDTSHRYLDTEDGRRGVTGSVCRYLVLVQCGGPVPGPPQDAAHPGPGRPLLRAAAAGAAPRCSRHPRQLHLRGRGGRLGILRVGAQRGQRHRVPGER